MPKRNFELQVYETEDYEESPLPGETLVFKEKKKKEESLEEIDDRLMGRLR